jgi:hypothetical protein
MANTKALYGVTLALVGAAGFSTGWTIRPPEVRYLTLEEQMMAEYEQNWRLTPAETERLRAVLGEFTREMDALRNEFDSRFEGQVTLVKDKYDAKIAAILVPEKRR